MPAELIRFDQRPSEAAQVQTIWRSTSDGPGSFISMAYPTWEFVFWSVSGSTGAVLRGPETVATHAQVPADGTWLGIRFKTGACLRSVDYGTLRDQTIELHMVGATHFEFAGATYEVPTFYNANCFVAQLARRGALAFDDRVSASLHEQSSTGLSARTMQRRFRAATGLDRQAVNAIERARQAASLLRNGWTIGDTIEAAGYCDQPHLTRALTRLIGQTPAALMRDRCPQLSFLEQPVRGG